MKRDAHGNPFKGAGSVVPNTIYPSDRRCEIAGCITILNIYNPGPDCLRHREIREALDEAAHRRIAAERVH